MPRWSGWRARNGGPPDAGAVAGPPARARPVRALGREVGRPACPLLWSHAMFLSLAHELARPRSLNHDGRPPPARRPHRAIPTSSTCRGPAARASGSRAPGRVARGISRHVVRFVDYDGALYALKELPGASPEREYAAAARLAEESIPWSRRSASVSGRADGPRGVLITRHLEFSLPYRRSSRRRGVADLRNQPARRARRSCSRACTSRGSSGATARSRTRSSAATPARCPPTSSTPRPASCTRSSPTASASTTCAIAEENLAGELLDVEARGRAAVRTSTRSRPPTSRAAATRGCGRS